MFQKHSSFFRIIEVALVLCAVIIIAMRFIQPTETPQDGTNSASTAGKQSPNTATTAVPPSATAVGEIAQITLTPSPSALPTKVPTPKATLTPEPTSTPPPTATPPPTFTPLPPDTAAGTTLTEDNIWRQAGMTLAIHDKKYYHVYQISNWAGTEDHRIAFIIAIEFENHTGKDALVSWKPDTYRCYDNAGTEYPVAYVLRGFGANPPNANNFSEIIKDGQQLQIEVACGNDQNLNERATHMMFSVAKLGKIANAKWQFDI